MTDSGKLALMICPDCGVELVGRVSDQAENTCDGSLNPTGDGLVRTSDDYHPNCSASVPMLSPLVGHQNARPSALGVELQHTDSLAPLTSTRKLLEDLGPLADTRCQIVLTGNLARSLQAVSPGRYDTAEARRGLHELAGIAEQASATVLVNMAWFAGRRHQDVVRVACHEIYHVRAWQREQDSSQLIAGSDRTWDTLMDMVTPDLLACQGRLSGVQRQALIEGGCRVVDEYRVESSVRRAGFTQELLRGIDTKHRAVQADLAAGTPRAAQLFGQWMAHNIAHDGPPPADPAAAKLHHQLTAILHDVGDAEKDLSVSEAVSISSLVIRALTAWYVSQLSGVPASRQP
jgi:hypothetical protein